MSDCEKSTPASTVIQRQIYRFGAPFFTDDRRRFIDDLKSRFSDGERASSFLDVITDRIVTKAAGLLQYNAVILAITYLLTYKDVSIDTLNKGPIYVLASTYIGPIRNILILIALSTAILSSLFAMTVMFTHWRKDYRCAWREVEYGAMLCMKRCIKMTIAIYLSIMASIIDIILLAIMTISVIIK